MLFYYDSIIEQNTYSIPNKIRKSFYNDKKVLLKSKCFRRFNVLAIDFNKIFIKMEKRLATLALLICSLATASAQKVDFGAHAGINVSGFHGGDPYLVYDKSTKVGAEIGGDVTFHLSSHLMLLSGLNFSQYGGKFSVMSPYIGAVSNQLTEFKEVNTRVLSLEIPLKIGYEFNIGNNFSIIPNAGVFGRYTVASIKSDVIQANGTTQKWNSLKDYDKDLHHIDAFKRFDYGIVGGVDFRIAKHYSVSASYKHGLKSQQPQYNLKSNSFNVSVGYTL